MLLEDARLDNVAQPKPDLLLRWILHVEGSLLLEKIPTSPPPDDEVKLDNDSGGRDKDGHDDTTPCCRGKFGVRRLADDVERNNVTD